MRIAQAHMFTLRILRGIERCIVNLSNAFVRQGHEAVIVTGRTDAPKSADALDPRVEVHMVPHWDWHKVTFVPGFALDFLRNEYGALLVNLARGEGWAVALADRLRRLDFSIVLQYPVSGHHKQYRNWKWTGAARRARRLIAVSRYVAEGVEAYLGRRPHVITNGVDPEKFRFDPEARLAVRRDLGLDDRDRLVVTVSALQGRKGIGHVVAALPRLLARANGTRIRYAIVGDGAPQDRAALEAAVRSAGLESTVTLVGLRSDPERYLSAADAFALLSVDEACPTVTLEALACGLPVVVSNGSAFPELVPPGGGRLVRPDDHDAVADALGDVLAAGRPGDAARAPTVARFAWEQIAGQYAAVLAGP
ncbi:MAG TPA: glycosyltransferase family 4 protein [Thermodesulfobacteriota bacterium]